MGFSALKRVVDRTYTPSDRDTNDILVFSKGRKGEDGEKTFQEMFRISSAQMKAIDIQSSNGVYALFDDEDKKVALAVLPSEFAQAYKGRKDIQRKSQEASYGEVIAKLEEYGFIPADRTPEFRAAFDLVAADQSVVDAVRGGIEGLEPAVTEKIVAIYELVPAELITMKKAVNADGTAAEPVLEGDETEEEGEDEDNI